MIITHVWDRDRDIVGAYARRFSVPHIMERCDQMVSNVDTVITSGFKSSYWTYQLTNEELVLLLILAEGGILLFSYPFSDEIKVDDELFGGFLSAISTFSDASLSEGLDRAKFGQYTVLIENLADFSFCYLIKGQTYLAKKKLSNFVENFQKNTSMMNTLDKFQQTSQLIDIEDFPFLEGFINEIFVNK